MAVVEMNITVYTPLVKPISKVYLFIIKVLGFVGVDAELDAKIINLFKSKTTFLAVPILRIKMVNAGELNKKLILREPTTTREAGSKITTFTDGDTIKAKIERANQVRAIDTSSGLLNTDIIHIRYSISRSNITDEWLLKYDDVDHTITGIEVLGANEFIRLTAKVKNG